MEFSKNDIDSRIRASTDKCPVAQVEVPTLEGMQFSNKFVRNSIYCSGTNSKQFVGLKVLGKTISNLQVTNSEIRLLTITEDPCLTQQSNLEAPEWESIILYSLGTRGPLTSHPHRMFDTSISNITSYLSLGSEVVLPFIVTACLRALPRVFISRNTQVNNLPKQCSIDLAHCGKI